MACNAKASTARDFSGTKKAAAPFDAAALFRQVFDRLLKFGRDVVEGAAQLVADVAHRGNRGNGNESGNQAVLNRGRTLVILDQLKKLGHLWSPSGSTKGIHISPPPQTKTASVGYRITARRVEKALKTAVSKR